MSTLLSANIFRLADGMGVSVAFLQRNTVSKKSFYFIFGNDTKTKIGDVVRMGV